ncbi:OsmC family protein [Bdellovibrio sp.]
MACQTKWMGDMGFESQIRDHKVPMDAKSDFGGKDQGPSPKELVLAGICGCTGMDVVSILKKMRVNLQSCDVNAETDTTEGHPSIFTTVELQFRLQGPDVKPEQAMKAVNLSMTKYCGVSAMIVKASPIRYQVYLNDLQIGEGQSQFESASE